MKTILAKLLRYLPDQTVLDERPAFDDDLSAPFFQRGGDVGCLVLHGIGGTPANVRVLADRLAAEGYTVLAPVLPGHRETVRALNASTGAEWKACAEEAYDRLVAAGCRRVYVLGLSLGGLLSIHLAEERPAAGLVVLCAPIKMQRFLRFARWVSPVLPFVRYPSDDRPDSWRHNPYAQMYDGFSTVKLVDIARLSREVVRRLGSVACPALWFSAKYDDKVDQKSADIFQNGAVNVPSFARIFLENSPHGCTYGPERDRIAAEAAAFIRDVEASSKATTE